MTITIRPAPPLGSYPTLRSVHELDLLPTIRVEHCACGEYVRQLAGDTITDVVRRHNDTISHRAWRSDRSPLSDPTVAPGAVDVSNVPAMRPAGERQA